MHPILFSFGPLTIYSFGLALAVAIMVCAYGLSRDVHRIHVDRQKVFDFVFWVALAGIVGARLFYVGLNLNFFLENPAEFIQIQHGGLAWQGGFILGVPVAIMFLKRNKMAIVPFLDLAVPYVALGQAIGRIGCWFNGCCYGKPLKWGPYVPIHEAHLHPAQLYESVGLLLIFLFLRFSPLAKTQPGVPIVFYLILAAALRLVVQFFRYDYDPIFAGLGLYQWIAVGILIAGVIVYIRLVRK